MRAAAEQEAANQRATALASARRAAEHAAEDHAVTYIALAWKAFHRRRVNLLEAQYYAATVLQRAMRELYEQRMSRSHAAATRIRVLGQKLAARHHAALHLQSIVRRCLAVRASTLLTSEQPACPLPSSWRAATIIARCWRWYAAWMQLLDQQTCFMAYGQLKRGGMCTQTISELGLPDRITFIDRSANSLIVSEPSPPDMQVDWSTDGMPLAFVPTSPEPLAEQLSSPPQQAHTPPQRVSTDRHLEHARASTIVARRWRRVMISRSQSSPDALTLPLDLNDFGPTSPLFGFDEQLEQAADRVVTGEAIPARDDPDPRMHLVEADVLRARRPLHCVLLLLLLELNVMLLCRLSRTRMHLCTAWQAHAVGACRIRCHPLHPSHSHCR